MSMEEIVRYGNKALAEPTKDVMEFNDEIKELINRMYKIMEEANGAGLAANQIGLPLRMFVYDDGSGPHAMINPKMIRRTGSQIASEGCLSIPGLFGDVDRANITVVEGINENGEKVKITGEGLLARIFQHEMDHLDGKLFIDRANSKTLHWVIPGQDEEE